MTNLSVIIPLAPDETAWQNLLEDLAHLPEGCETLLIASEGTNEPPDLPASVHFLTAPPGRARQMNAGAKSARNKHLWFLHADSEIESKSIRKLLERIKKHPRSLLYFDLTFLSDGSPFMPLNAWGVYLRSHLLKVPFGDQGFCITKKLFEQIGGYPENVPYGEDHLFLWYARQKNIPITPVGATLFTSARKYRKNGWLKTTIQHQAMWLTQAWPEFKKLIGRKKR